MRQPLLLTTRGRRGQHHRTRATDSPSVAAAPARDWRVTEMVKISAALKHFTGMPSRNSRILEDVLEKCRARESHCRASARRQMQTYGLLYKQGHFVKNWQTRLFILSGGQLKYYVPGDTEAKGTIMLHQIRTVQPVTVRHRAFDCGASPCHGPSLRSRCLALRFARHTY